jgi:predicted esterase
MLLSRIIFIASLVACSFVLKSCLPDPPSPSSICYIDGIALTCPHNTINFSVDGENRTVHYKVPNGNAPTGGWPAVILFQGTLFTAQLTWTASPSVDLFGAYNQTKVVQKLLDNGYAVLTPETHLSGLTFWDTNNPLVPNFDESNDHKLMLRIFQQLEENVYGNINTNKLFAGGISSGGYMTSRMALQYPGKFKALAIAAGSYANCAGPICPVGYIPSDHPPTLFLHGSADPVVPLFTMETYYDKLRQNGIPVRKIIEPLSFHRWIDASPNAVLNWFNQY